MKLRRLVLSVTLLLALPSVPLARWIVDQVVMKSPATGEVIFSHYAHLEALGKNCPTCHNTIFNIVKDKNPAVTMAEMGQGKSCGACHNGTKAFNIKESCATCHPTKEITFKLPDAGDVAFSHEVHTGLYSCSECHPGIFIPGPGNKTFTMEQMEKGEACGTCHDGGTAFTVKENCEKCHKM